MTNQDLDALLKIALDAAHVGAKILKDNANVTLEATTKGDINNFVTQVDLQSETAVRNFLRQARPSDEISGEEYATDSPENAKVRWSIDPLDGTINFMRRIPFFSTSVGAQDLETGEWIVGAVVAPEINTIWFAKKGHGSFVERNGKQTKLQGPPNRESKIVATGFAYSPAIRTEQFAQLGEAMANFQDLRRMGSASIDLCYVAEGILDAYFERDIKEHDWAAAALICEEAGVTVKRPAFAGDVCTAGI